MKSAEQKQVLVEEFNQTAPVDHSVESLYEDDYSGAITAKCTCGNTYYVEKVPVRIGEPDKYMVCWGVKTPTYEELREAEKRLMSELSWYWG